MPEYSEVELVARARQGDMDAIGSLYDQHRESIFRYLWLRLGDQPLAEDLAGDVFLRMLDALPRYQALGLPFRAWLYRIAHNMLVDYFRKTKNRTPISIEALNEYKAIDDPPETVERRLLAEQVNAALSQLDQSQRDTVVLRFLMGLSLQETALALGKSEAAVKALQHRGLNALRRALYPVEEQVTL